MIKRQFKDIPSNTCLDSPDRRALDLNGKGPGSILTGVTYYCWIFLFSHSKASSEYCQFCVFVKNSTVPENFDQYMYKNEKRLFKIARSLALDGDVT